MIPPERLLRALLLQALFTIRSERQVASPDVPNRNTQGRREIIGVTVMPSEAEPSFAWTEAETFWSDYAR